LTTKPFLSPSPGSFTSQPFFSYPLPKVWPGRRNVLFSLPFLSFLHASSPVTTFEVGLRKALPFFLFKSISGFHAIVFFLTFAAFLSSSAPSDDLPFLLRLILAREARFCLNSGLLVLLRLLFFPKWFFSFPSRFLASFFAQLADCGSWLCFSLSRCRFTCFFLPRLQRPVSHDPFAY